MLSSRSSEAARFLVVNADDFGFTRDVNAGIVEAHRNGILTATTLMANGAAFEDAIALCKGTPTLDVGIHLVFVQGHSLATGNLLPERPQDLCRALLRRRIDLYQEGRAQIEKILISGLKPTHVDTHKHTHVLPTVFRAVVKLAIEFNIPFVRLPFDTGWLPAKMGGRWHKNVLAKNGLRATRNFIGFRLTDSLSEATLIQTLENLPYGTTELMCHPGYLQDELKAAPTRLKDSRQRELTALTSNAVKQVIARNNIQVVNYRQLLSIT